MKIHEIELLENITTESLMKELCHRITQSNYLGFKLDKWISVECNAEFYALKIINLNDVNRKE